MEPEMVIASGPSASSADIVKTAQDRVTLAYSKHTKPSIAFDPSVILDLILSVLESCTAVTPTPSSDPVAQMASVKAIMTQDPILARFRIRRSMRTSGYLNRPDAEAIISTVVDVATQSTPSEMLAFTQYAV